MYEQCSLIVVIVPFVDWGPLIDRCVSGCVALHDENFHICLVTQNVAVVPPRWSANPLVSVLESEGEGISHKRNVAIHAFPHARYFACIDSDAWPQTEWLKAARRVFEMDPDIWIVGGPNLNPPDLSPERIPVASALLSPLVSGPKLFVKCLSSSRDATDLPACNLLIRKEAVDFVGGFDESVEVGEDSVLCQQIVSHGKRIRFDSDVRVFHEPRCFGTPFLRQRIVSGYGIPPLLRRCWRSMSLVSIMAELSPTIFLLWLALGWVGGILFPTVGFVWPGILAIYFAIILLETLRVSSQYRYCLKTGMAILIGNLSPGMGTLYRLIDGRLAIGRYYRNDV